jgi:hypothetical protein
MIRSGSVLVACSLLMIAVASLGCGGRSQLKSISVSPASADAKNFPSGRVQFTATGMFSGSSSAMPLESPAILWCVGERTSAANGMTGVCSGNVAQFASIDQNGLAQCVGPLQGTVYILAGTYSTPTVPDQGQQLTVFGSAQLTCP